MNQNNTSNPDNSLPDIYDPSQIDAVDHTFSPQAEAPAKVVQKPREKKTRKKRSCSGWLVVLAIILIVFFTPLRINILVMGIDSRPGDEWMGRSDTMILTTIPPVLPQVKSVSIPRDLWVTIPGHPDNRINTAHFFAEVAEAGTGPKAAAEAINVNFGIKFPYTVRLRFDGVQEIVDAMGGVTITLPNAMSGLDAGTYHMDGTQLLAFVRDRETSDDFFRQMRGQMFIKAAMKQMLNPANWHTLPAVIKAVDNTVQINLPFYLWPRVGYSLLFTAVKGFDMQNITREMITPFVTDQGAQVLLPNWDMINPFMKSVFH